MLSRSLLVEFALLALATTLASAFPSLSMFRKNNGFHAPSCNEPNDRSCWVNGFDVNTDWDDRHPITGATRRYEFFLTEIDKFVGPDGQVKENAMLINGGFPGPIITADWGDRIEVNVVNNLRDNGTSIHWHGIRMQHNNINDGVPGVTECPIPPGSSKTYSFVASQYGTSWYHSHYSSQYGNGIVGTIQINGPSSQPYDIDLGVYPITDWYYTSVDKLLARVYDAENPIVPGKPGSPPPSDNVLFNGTNINPTGSGGEYSKITLTRGKRHRLRLINASVDNTYTVSIVGHKMTVIQTDFVPIHPFTTEQIYMTVGQRHDIIINANNDIDNYWLNVTFSSTQACGTSNNAHPAAIVHYKGASDDLPGDPGKPPVDSHCSDSNEFVPIIRRRAPRKLFSAVPSNTLPASMVVNTTSNQVLWALNGSSINLSWEKPTLEYVRQDNNSYLTHQNVISLAKSEEWSYWVIQNLSPIPHPMHLHGHDFVLLGRSPSLANPLDDGNEPRYFDASSDAEGLSWRNPTRRDTTVLPGWGWLVVAFEPSNPGSWVFHCHIAWHVSQGFSVQFLEHPSKISDEMDLGELTDNCEAWREYAPTNRFLKGDSGI